MTNWSSVSEITNEAAVLTHLIFVLFGLYVWEILITLGFEWSLITKARKFSWPLVSTVIVLPFLFFLCRYSLVGALIGMIVSFQVKTPINCQALYTWNSVSGNLAILAASTSLLLRTIALWNRRKIIIAILGTLCLGHWAILLRGMFLIDAQYSAEAQGCVVTSTNHIFLNVSFFTTMAVDFVVLCFTIAALARQEIHSGLWKLLFKDGLVYFCITFLCNAVPAILNVINLNTVMDIIATIPAATVSTIAACRLIMRLQEFSNSESVYVNTASANAYGPNQFAMVSRPPPRTPEIRVTTDQFVVEDFSPAECSSKMHELDSQDHTYSSDVEDYKHSPTSMNAV